MKKAVRKQRRECEEEGKGRMVIEPDFKVTNKKYSDR